MNRIFWMVCFLSLNFSTPVFAQSELVAVWGDSFFSTESPEKIALVSRSPKEIETETTTMETLIRDSMYESGRFSVVKDDRDFPDDFKARQILGAQDFSFLCFLDGYKARKQPRFELKCFRETDLTSLSFLGTKEDLKMFAESKTLKKEHVESKPVVKEKQIENKVQTSDAGKEVVGNARRIIKDGNDETRLYFDPTRKDSRRILIGRKRTRLDHADFYERIGEPQLKEAYLEKGTLRTTLFIVGSTAIAVGAGLIFGGVFSNANCGNDASCKSNILTIIGGTTLGLGGISIATGFLINRYPTSSKEDKEAIDFYNENPKRD